MAIDITGQYWHGETRADLAEYLREFRAGGYAGEEVTESVCASSHSSAR
ncbi:erythromycin esterase-like protein [Micromonospora echinospora]|uniref:Erythromycin esterase-like protein n=1 Tax=Micromonospora echinospora TaxID=1877 RepID=A0ABR6M5P5_MICEC|nr:hypothetical protein [Micromonospora echinospora]MBB5110532.1 erythromycin esterase-like protein [Micromonospora echinospora]